MTSNNQKILCPKCDEEISIDDVMRSQIEGKIRKEFEATQKTKEAEFAKKEEKLKTQEAELEKSKKNADTTIEKKLEAKLKKEKAKLFKVAQDEAEKEQKSKTDLLEQQLKSKEEKLEKARKNEIELLQEKGKLKEEKDAFELEKVRQLEEAKIKLTEDAKKNAADEQQYIIAQYKKKITDITKVKDEMARKLEQGSQQTQGEVLELELEEVLKSEFISDEIAPVPKGVRGADVIQKVHNKSGQVCGQIVWEIKKTKSWSDGWIQKLKDDQRAIKADIAVFVSFALPEDIKGFAFKDGIWICDVKMIIALATSLRINLKAIYREKLVSVGKNKNMEILYSYLTGVEFKQRVEAILETFKSMDDNLRKERLAYEKN